MSETNTNVLMPKGAFTDVHERVAERWSFEYKLPLPKWAVSCPQCEAHDVVVKQWVCFTNKQAVSASKRIDVQFKCTRCSIVFIFGIPVTDNQYNVTNPGGGNVKITGREGAEKIRELMSR